VRKREGEEWKEAQGKEEQRWRSEREEQWCAQRERKNKCVERREFFFMNKQMLGNARVLPYALESTVAFLGNRKI
jgi:hypothetical protein